MVTIQEYKEDIEELTSLRSEAKRIRCQSIIDNAIIQLRGQLEDLEDTLKKAIIAPRKRRKPSLRDYHFLPKWIEDSDFIKQYRIDYENDVIQLDEEIVFDLPDDEFNDINEVIRILESCRFFGIHCWSIFRRIIAYFLKNPLIDEIAVGFAEFDNVWISLRFLVLHGLNKTTCCDESAKKGCLFALKYAHENGYVWNERTCFEAADGGHFDCLKYAHENGCPWNERTCV
jgi:hypothetical protein